MARSRVWPRERRPASTADFGAGAAWAVTAGGTASISACSALSVRAVSLPPGTHRFSRSSDLANSASA